MEGTHLRPLGVGGTLDVAINVYFRNLANLLRVAAFVAIPIAVIVFALDQVAFAGSPTPAEIFSNPDTYGTASVGQHDEIVNADRFNLIQGIEVAVALVSYLLIAGATYRAVSDAYLGREVDAGASLRFAARQSGRILWLGFLAVLGILLGFLLLIVPGIYLLVAWSVALPAILFEDIPATEGLGRSMNLVRNNWWRTLAVLLVGFIFIGLFSFLLGLAASGLTAATEDSLVGSLVIVDAFQAISTIVTAPLQAAFITVIYYNLRVRKEGLDLQLAAEGLDPVAAAPPRPGAPPPPPPPPPPPGSFPPSQPPPSAAP